MDQPQAAKKPLELWAGVECTVNRVGDRYFNQLERNGHARRADDIDLFAALGIRTLRYPVLWDLLAPESPEDIDWAWPDERFNRLRELGIRPIVGLLHHGSGPRYTSLTDPDFAPKLAAFARAVAERYPWVDAYTPVNEPLTTARFSGIYGHWYPHGRDDQTFTRALSNQCAGTMQAMQEIRRVNPDAQLVQTDDLGYTHSTAFLAYQAEYENERRWLTWDLLAGRVAHDHPMWSYLLWAGLEERELLALGDRPCPADVIGVNYYLTSERYLDDRLDRYPPLIHGGNGRERYVDVEAVRVRGIETRGWQAAFRDACDRYGKPVVATEVHLGCTREEQMRWLAQAWDAAQGARAAGCDVPAITAWSLLGAYDWNTLVTEDNDFYEPGAFDVRSGQPRPTALAGLVAQLASGQTPDHPVLASPGWWQRDDRFRAEASTEDAQELVA